MGETITIATGDGSFSAYVARPSAPKAPAIVVILEIFGVNKVMRDITDGLAAQGYLAVCPDLFWRIEPGIDITDQTKEEWARAFELYQAFDVEKGVEDIQATIDLIRADPNCSGKVGAVGFCLGGLLAFLTATRTDADASVSYYGVNIDSYVAACESEKLVRPVMLHVAEEDEFVSKDAQQVILDKLENHPQVKLFTYPGRNHAFARVGGAHYDETDARKAGGRSLEFFETHLR